MADEQGDDIAVDLFDFGRGPVVLAEQNAAFAVKVADYAHVMSKGKVVHSTDPATLWADEDIKTRLLGVPAGGPERPPDASV